MAKSKTPTPQEIYRQRRQREEQEKTAHLPPGLINHGNTCFMNSVLQGLIATRLLRDLVLFNPIPSEVQRTASTPIISRRSPQLTNGHNLAGEYVQPWVNTMPIGDRFLTVLYQAWQSQGSRRRDVASPKPLLAALGQKYDQYLDFAQQDAHEFLRILLDAMRMEEQDIIKKRQPPPPQKKRRRTTITNVSDSSQPNGNAEPHDDPDDDLPLLSFADMLFGGQLTSILVCQKCKRVSQTYEEFNDISLSIKAEDYLPHNRKRDRFKKMVGKLTQFPGTEKSEKVRVHLPIARAAVEMQRSSSVPPSPRADVKPLDEELPITDGPRRRSLDVHPAIGPTPDSPELPIQEKDREDDKSDHSVVIVNIVPSEEKHVEFVDPTIPNRREGSGDSDKEKDAKEPEKEKEKSQDGWAKLGRRISMTVGIGRPRSDKEGRKDRERKTRSMDRSGMQPAIKEGIVSPLKPLPCQPISASSSTPIVTNPPLSQPPIAPAPSLAPTASTSNSIFPHVHRSKSPKPPKPSAAETEYLRKILADISTSPASANPFAIFKPPLIHNHQNNHHPRAPFAGSSPLSRPGTPGTGSRGGGEKDKSPSAAAWLGMGVRSFSGIEDCLRMFTAVEVLDGENMVGCRRCWKIQNGMLSKSKDSDEYEEDEEDPPKRSSSPPVDTGQLVGVEVDPPPIVDGEKRRRPSLKPLTASHPATSIPTSLSTPTVSFYTHPDSSDTRSVSSLPTAPTSVKDSDENNSSDGSPSPLYFSVNGSETALRTHSEADERRQQGPGGLPIPVISTTAPPDTPASTIDSLSTLATAESQDSASTSKSGPSIASRLTQALYGSSGSKDSLVIPGKSGAQRRKTYSDATTTDDNDSSDDDNSDTSAGTSLSADSVVELGQQQAPTVASLAARGSQHSPPSTAAPPVQQRKAGPKPVIMRPAYKRYLIAVPPPVLVIHLKRFQQITRTPLISFSHGFKKLEDYVSFPEYLDLTPFLAPRKEDYGLGKKKGSKTKDKEQSRKVKAKAKEERCMYRLYAVVVHIGNMLGGHYIAYTALPPDTSISSSSAGSTATNKAPNGPSADSSAEATIEKETSKPASAPSSNPTTRERQWAYISDTTVRLTSLEEVLHAKAYICMYERC
ncbi:hypothetical protein M413DRAFT_70760 [Hebeloma cylindrosporum]|uniref:ubiquitinyl hydrolase 1 n=1 Tax=Hebeloma cylindrosporum TaxID=76867 RepID=A0A0C3CFI7_HEBCY|nr:hypothetical protein M413DRAFT_70760 [Hebeloma cylindrosporum h7]